MYKMIEVIGVSPLGFSEAVLTAVDQVNKMGERISWFEVAEQRGAVRNGQIKEYQVKLKVAVAASVSGSEKKADSKDQAEELCLTCGKPVGKGGHMCTPELLGDSTCDWCGASIPDERHLCNDKVRELAYVCNSCGRTAVHADNLCDPKKIKK